MRMDGNHIDYEAFVSLVTNDQYANGALVLGYSLRRVNTTRKLALLVTNQVTEPMRNQLSRVWDHIETVDPLDSCDDANLALLTRPELGITFTKIRCWNLTQFRKCVFLDADTLVLQNCDELFDRRELSAVPDIGWPDCFNSGVFVFEPSRTTYEAMLQFAIDHGSFDGGDQGLLNSFFGNWATEDIAKHISFIYNMNCNASYTYAPAYKQFGNDVKIVHFIGPIKPWHYSYSTETGTAYMPAYSGGIPHERNFIQLWWDIHATYVVPAMRQCSESPIPVHCPDNPNRMPDNPSHVPDNPSHVPDNPSQDQHQPAPYTPHQFNGSPSHHEHSQYNNVPLSPHYEAPSHEEIPQNPGPIQNSEDQSPSPNPSEDEHDTGENSDSIDTTFNMHHLTEDFQLLHLQHNPNLPTIDETNEIPEKQRTAWENGHPDYNGHDKFSNIQEKLDSTIQEGYRAIDDVPVLI